MDKRQRRFSGLAKNLAALCIGLFGVYGLWRVAEKVCHVLNERNDRRVTYGGNYYADFYRYDEVVGPKPAPNVCVRSIKKLDGAVVYDAVYTTDAFGRRASYASPPGDREAFLVFFGCSFTFGEGLQDSETFPWQVAALAQKYRVYNYACPGYGPQQMLAKIESGELDREIREKSGIAVYVFIPNHVRRAIGSMRVATKWGRAFPNYVVDPELGLVRRGNFTTGRPALTQWYKSLSNVDTLRYAGVDFPFFITRKHLEFTGRIVQRSAELFQSHFPGAQFRVLLYPDMEQSEMKGEVFARILDAQGIAYLDFTSLVDMQDARFTIKEDGHPSAAANKLIAEELVKTLRLGD